MVKLPLSALSFIGFLSARSNLLPLVFIALLLDSGIIAVWYYIGVLLNNRTVKAGARSEFGQLIGTAIIAGIVIGAIFLYGNTMYNALNQTQLMSSTAMTTMCNNIENYNNQPMSLIMSHSLLFLGPSDSILGGSSVPEQTGSQQAFPGFCNMLSPTTIDGYIDYPLVTTGVVLANVTNQTMANINEFYYVDEYISWLGAVKPSLSLTLNVGALGIQEFTSLARVSLSLALKFQPYAGYSATGRAIRALGNLFPWEFMVLAAQLIMSAAFLYIWPFLLFTGLILRALPFTRKIGGLFIAVAVGGLMFIPMLYAIEYLSLAHGIPNYTNLESEYGFNAIPPLPNNNGNINPPYSLNFFVQPSIRAIAEYTACPNGGSVNQYCGNGNPIWYIAADIVGLNTPVGGVKYIGGVIFKLLSRSSTNYQPTYLVSSWNSNVVLNFLFMTYNVYGIDTIIAWMIPLLNLAITLAGIRALSGMMGGDTSIAGLSKLV